MYFKLAIGNVRRSVRDYSVYFATLVLAACLLYSFIASGDYLQALDLTTEQRSVYARIGGVLSPAFGAVAAFVFDAPWRFHASFSIGAALWTAGCFVAITALGAVASARDVLRKPVVELMGDERRPERLAFGLRRAARLQLIAAVPLLAVVWGSCLVQPIYFIAFIMPMGFMAFGATLLVMRSVAWRFGERVRRREDAYWSGLRPFTVRQVEARVSSTSAALSCVCVLIAAAVCMTCAGFLFSVGMRGPGALAGASSLAPIGYVGIFYGAAFLVTAAAILALQQLSGAADARHAFETLRELGCGRDLARASLREQVRLCFVAPCAGACIHDVFGLCLVGFLAFAFQSSSFAPIVASVLGFTAAVMVVYYRLTCRACERLLLDREI